MTEWPSTAQVSVWGMNPDGEADAGFVFGDLDKDNIVDRQLPESHTANALNMSDLPPRLYLAYRIEIDDTTMAYSLIFTGNRFIQSLLLLFFGRYRS